MRLRKSSLSTVIASLALFFALGGSALAAHHYLITSTGQIKPSVLSKLKGHAGPAGTQGAQGAPGAQGPAGPSSLSTLAIVHGESKSIPSETVGSSVAVCPVGSHAISGGGYTGLANVADSEMSSDHQGWILVVVNETVISTHLEAIVYCAQTGQAVAAGTLQTVHANAARRAALLASRVAAEHQNAGH